MPVFPTSGSAVEPTRARAWPAGTLAFGAALAVGAAVRLWLSLHDDGIYWPDEIFQSLEPAHRLVFHYGFIPWEFIDGARSWAFPGLLAGYLKLCALVGLDQPKGYLLAARLLMCALSLGAAWGSYVLAVRLNATRMAAAAGASLWALAAPAIYFAPRALNETASSVPLVFGLALAVSKEAGRRERALGAALLGLAAALRLQNGVFCAGLLVVFLARRAWRPLLEAAAVLALCAVLYGLLDRLTWGEWFHSAFVYLRFNLVEGKAALWGTSDAGYYARALFRSMPLPSVLLLALGLLSLARAPAVGWMTIASLAIHSAVPHKELRFILPALPLACSLAAVGLDVAWARLPRAGLGLWALTMLSGAWSAWGFHELLFGQLGAYENEMPQVTAYDLGGPINRLLLAAHDRKDLCGLRVEVGHLAWTGGYSYLHRNVPLYGARQAPDRRSLFYNYVVTVPQGAYGAQVVARDGPLVLAKLFLGPCQQDANYSWRLP